MAELLLSQGASLELDVTDEDGLQYIHDAAKADDVEMVKWLLSKGASPTAATNPGTWINYCYARHTYANGWMPIRFAICSNNLELANVLLEATSPTVVDNNGVPLIHHAVDDGDLEMVKLFHARGASLTAVDAYGTQPIHIAARNCNLETARWLHAQSVDVTAMDNGGNTALQLARRASLRSSVIEQMVAWLEGLPAPAPAPAPAAPVRQRNSVPIGTIVGSRASASISTGDLAYGTLLIGDPGSGKTYMLKYLIEKCGTQLGTLKQIIVLDLKGDLTQMIRSAPGANGDFDQHVDVRVYTVGADMGLHGTRSAPSTARSS